MIDQKFDALMRLINDPDLTVKAAVEAAFIAEGLEIIPRLEKTWELSTDTSIQGNIENLIQKLQFTHTKHALKFWKEDENAEDIIKGSYLIARYQYPELKIEEINLKIEQIKRNIWLELRDNFTALEQINVLNHIFFQIEKFSRNAVNFFAPQNSYINLVLDSKKGNPISLAIIYMAVAQRLNIPLYGINLPKNYILAYVDDSSKNLSVDEITQEDILFYVNPFNRGAILSKKDIDYFLKQQQIASEHDFFFPCDNLTTISRLLDNLIFSYNRLGYADKISELKILRKILKKK